MTKAALASYIAKSDPDGIDDGLEQRPLVVFTHCYVAAFALDLVNEKPEAILTYCNVQLAKVKVNVSVWYTGLFLVEIRLEVVTFDVFGSQVAPTYPNPSHAG